MIAKCSCSVARAPEFRHRYWCAKHRTVPCQHALGALIDQALLLQQRQQVVFCHDRPQFLPPPQLPIVPPQAGASSDAPPQAGTSSDAPPPPSPNAPPLPQCLFAPIGRRPAPLPQYLRRILLRFSQTPGIQQPPRLRKTRRPNVPPVLPQQVEHAQLMRRLPAIDQPNPRCNSPIAITNRMLRLLRPQLPGPVNHFRPRAKSAQRRPPAARSGLPSFGTPPAGSHPQPVRFQHTIRQLGHRQWQAETGGLGR